MAEWLLSVLLPFVQSNPQVAAVIGVLGVLRLIMKPLMAFLHLLVDATPYDQDNKWLASAEMSPVYKGLCFILDWVASIKLPEKS